MPIVRRTRADLNLDKVDWAAIAKTTDKDIDAQIAADPDTAPIFTDWELARARRVFPKQTSGNVRALRRRLGLSQAQFAKRFGFSIETLRNYEQGHRQPNGPARILLEVIAAEPDAVTRTVLRHKAKRA
jgi:putative transcriptional regulator